MTNENESGDAVTLAQAAKALKVSQDFLLALAGAGKLIAMSFGSNVRFKKSDLRELFGFADIWELVAVPLDENKDIPTLSLEDAAELSKLSKNTVYRLVRAGVLKAYKVGHGWRITRADLAECLKSGRWAWGSYARRSAKKDVDS